MRGKPHTANKTRVISIAAITSIAVGIVLVISGMFFYQYRIKGFEVPKTMSDKECDYHYAIISEEVDAPFWDDIYLGALEMGKEQNAYIEKFGSNLSVSYSLYDLMKIAIASKVDGIILEPNGEENIDELINEADEAGIPVVTVLKDAQTSKRKSFIGINRYNQGQVYGKEILELLAEGRHNIIILLNEDYKDSSQMMIYSTILEIVENRNVEVKTATVNTQSTFSSEEDIRNLIMDNQNPPDALVCLTAVDTLCAYQAIVDYNKVGKIDIIGYYDSNMILRAIEKDNVHATMTIDARKMGAYCVEALTEYKKTNHVSDYYSIDISVINKDNVMNYIETEEQEIQEN